MYGYPPRYDITFRKETLAATAETRAANAEAKASDAEAEIAFLKLTIGKLPREPFGQGDSAAANISALWRIMSR